MRIIESALRLSGAQKDITKSLLIFALITITAMPPTLFAQDDVIPTGVPTISPLSHERDQIAWSDGEHYDMLTGVMNHYFIDMQIEGNGSLPITIARKHGSNSSQFGLGGIGLSIPKIEFASNGGGAHFEECRENHDTSCGGLTVGYKFHPPSRICSGLKLALGGLQTSEYSDKEDPKNFWSPARGIRNLRSGIKFTDGLRQIHFFPKNEYPGNVSRFPSSADYVSPDNWYIDCNGSTFNVHADNGVIYSMSNWYSSQANKPEDTSDRKFPLNHFYARHAIYVSQISDAFGNTLDYAFTPRPVIATGDTYVSQRIVAQYKSPKLTSISASDGRRVNLEYPNSGRGQNTVQRIYDNSNDSRSISYASDTRRGEWLQLTYKDSTKSIYRWARPNSFNSILRGLIQSIELPTGGKIVYEYDQTGLSNYVSGGRVPGDVAVLKKRTLHPRPDGLNTVTIDFNWHDLGNDQFVRTVNNASNTLEYRLNKTRRRSAEMNGNTFIRKPAAGRLFEIKNHGSRVTWSEALKAEYRKTINWIEINSVADVPAIFSAISGNNNRSSQVRHLGYSSYFEANMSVPQNIWTKLRTSAGNEIGFSAANLDFNDFGQPQKIVEFSNDNYFTNTLIDHFSNTKPWINGLVKKLDIFDRNSNLDHSIINTYNGNGSLKQSRVNGVNRDYTYHDFGELKTTTNAEGHKYQYTSYFRGVPYHEIDEIGKVTQRHVQTDGTIRWESTKGERQHNTWYEYDSLKRLSKITTPEGRITTIRHSPTRTVSETHGLVSVVRRDGLGREIFNGTEGDGNWTSVYTRYDADGRKRFISFPGDLDEYNNNPQGFGGTTYSYDGLGRITKMSRPAGDISYVYNVNGFGVQEIDGEGNRTTRWQRSFGDPSKPMLTQIHQVAYGNEEIRSTIQRDSVGRVNEVNRAGVVRQYKYNDNKRLREETHPEADSIQYSYWPDGQMHTRSSGGVVTTLNYDAHNKLKQTQFVEGGKKIQRNYDYRNDDALINVRNISAGYGSDGVTETGYGYDWDGNLVIETQKIDGQTRTLRYAYDDRGAMQSVWYPNGRRYDYNPSTRGWPTKIVDGNGKLIFDNMRFHPNGTIRYLKTPNTEYQQSQTPDKLPQTLVTRKQIAGSVNQPLVQQTYTYDNNLNVKQIEGLVPSNRQVMSYDELNRLVYAESGMFGRLDYKYDARDHIDWSKHNGVLTDYSYDGKNRLERMKTAGTDRWFSYDPRGNTRTTGKNNLVFNAADQVVTTNDGANYSYDGQGRRVKTVRDGKTIYQMYDQNGLLRYREEPASNLTSEYLYINDKLFARRDTDDGEGDVYGEIFRDDFDGNSVSSNFSMPTWAIPGRAAVNNLNSCSQSDGVLSLAIKNVGNESQACYLISNIADIGPGDDSTIKVDFHANVSGVKAQGAWFAGWIYPKGLNADGSHPAEDNDPTTGTEYDVFEYMPTWDTAYNTAIHDGASEQQWIHGDLLNGIDLTADEFHTYSMEWNKDCVVFSIDGTPTRGSKSALISSAKKHALYLTMEAQTGVQWDHWDVGDFAHNLNANPTVGKIDWVSVSRKAGIDPTLCDSAPPSDPNPNPDPDPNGLTEPTVVGNVLSWPSQGWWQIQQATAPYTEVCNSTLHGTSCTLADGTYQAINHTSGDRFPNIIVPNATNPDPDPDGVTEPTVVGNVLSWPSQGWWQIQQATAPYTEVCNSTSHGTSCTLADGTYQAINHTNGDRFPNIIVPNATNPDPDPDGVTEPTVVGNVLSWPSQGWWQIQQATAPYTEVCNSTSHGTSCTLADGTYQAINHTNGDRFPNIIVPSGGSEPPSGAPTPPTVTGQAYSKSAIEIQWSGASDSDGTVVNYDVYRNGVKSQSTDGRSWWQEGLSANTAYLYEVVAIDNDGKQSARSAAVTIRTNP